MKTILLFLAVLFNSLLLGQVYRPMLDSDNRWLTRFLNTQEGDSDGYFYLLKLSEQTTIFNEKSYRAIQQKSCYYNNLGVTFEWSEWWDTEVYLHENIEEKKVYIYYNDHSFNHDLGEFLLYDFSMEVGDSYNLEGFFNVYSPDPLTVTSITNEDVYDLQNVKTYQFNPSFDNLKVYEGIGSSMGLFSLSDFEAGFFLDDFYKIENDYIPIIKNGYGWEFSFNMWDFEQGQMHYTDFQAKPSGEEIIYNEKNYKAIEWRTRERIDNIPQTDWTSWETKFYLSENVANREVHIYYPDNTVFNHPAGEYLLYDFNLNEGDNVNLDGFNEYNESNIAEIQSITYENIFGQENARTYNLSANNGEFQFQIYEGIGSSYGLINLSFMYDAGWTLNHYGILSSSEFDKKETQVYPNPFTNQIQIDSEKTFQHLKLFDANGKLILSKKSISELNSNLNQLQKGMYILQILYPNQQKENIKLIKK